MDLGGDSVPATPLRWQPIVGFAFLALERHIDAVSGFCHAVAVEFFSASNHVEQQETFQRRAALEIEALASGVDPLSVTAGPFDDDFDDDEDED